MQPHPMVIILFAFMFAIPILLICLAGHCKKKDMAFTKKLSEEAQGIVVSKEMAERISGHISNTRERITWDQYFMGLAFAVAQRSEDPSIKHGCVLVSRKENIILATGYNGLIPGLSPDKVDIHTRPEKYKWMQHSEKNAVLNATQPLKFVDGGVKAYITGLPCTDCIQILSIVGVKEIYIANRRGYLHHDQKIIDDFDLVIAERGIKLVRMDLKDVDWLHSIVLE